jgi:uncharacterized protein
MLKPIGPLCNLNCTYCFYLSKKDLLPGRQDWRMSEAVLERLTEQYIHAQEDSEVTFAWQGGEPTLLGVGFFKRALSVQKKHCPPGKRVVNTLQTNGILLDDEWCRFLHDNEFLVGLSVDGPPSLHDQYRVDREGRPTSQRVLAAVERLHRHKVEFNTLTVVNRVNAQHPASVYRYLRNTIGSRYIQFIPCVEPKGFASVAPHYLDESQLPLLGDPASRPGAANSIVTEWSVDPDDYGAFLCRVFDRWLKVDVGEVFVMPFEVALGQWLGMPASACTSARTCGQALAVEHDGSVYSCDHYVYPEYRLGSIEEQPLADMALSECQMGFGKAKSRALPRYCRECEVLFACNGDCPRNRLLRAPDGEPGLSYLCSGLRAYYRHIDPWMKLIATEIKGGRTADRVMKMVKK